MSHCSVLCKPLQIQFYRHVPLGSRNGIHLRSPTPIIAPDTNFKKRLRQATLRAEPPFVFLSEEEKRRLRLNHFKPFRSPRPKPLDYSNLFSLVKLVSSRASILFLINCMMVITEPAVASTRLLGQRSVSRKARKR